MTQSKCVQLSFWKLPSKGIIGLLPRTCTSTQIEHSVDYLVNLAEMIREPEER